MLVLARPQPDRRDLPQGWSNNRADEHHIPAALALSDPAMEEALYEIASLRAFVRLSLGEPIPDETTILRFRHLLEKHDLATDMLRVVNDILQAKGLMMRKGTVVDATLIAAPSSRRSACPNRFRSAQLTPAVKPWSLVWNVSPCT